MDRYVFPSEIKAREEGKIAAVVSVFSSIDLMGDRFLPGAFAKSINRRKPTGVWNHDWSRPIAKTTMVKELLPGDKLLPPHLKDQGGLYIEGELLLTIQPGREAYEVIKAGIVDQFSIGFKTEKSRWNEQDGCREIQEVTLFEWSPVIAPAHPGTALVSLKRRNRAGINPAEFRNASLEDIEQRVLDYLDVCEQQRLDEVRTTARGRSSTERKSHAQKTTNQLLSELLVQRFESIQSQYRDVIQGENYD